MKRPLWILRRELLLADLFLLGTIDGLLLMRLIEGPGNLGWRPLALVPITYLVVFMHGLVWLSEPRGPQSHRWLFTQVVKRLSDLAIGFAIFVFVMAPEPLSEPFSGGSSASIFGIPAGILVLAVGIAGLVGGWIWIRLIARGEPVPESNDRFWRSRA